MRATLAALLLLAQGSPDDFVVHEWGTFTSFAGSDGVHLEFRPLADNDLPGFVYDRARQGGLAASAARALRTKFTTRALQRMETPVLYFYSDRERDVRVKVDFPRGLLTEFYPPVAAMSPEFRLGFPAKLEKSSLDWGPVRVLAKGGEHGEPPAVKGPNHYAAARETDANPLRVTVGGVPFREDLLFYRGVGRFTLPLKVTALGNDRFFVINHLLSGHSGPHPISTAFLVDVKRGRLRYARARRVTWNEITLPERASTADALAADMVAALVREGLYGKEARAMARTWRASWFEEEGTRLLYMLPRRMTDRLLPLHLDPKPESLVRVMVGRLEVLTPEREKEIVSLVGRLGSESIAEREDAQRALKLLGRFAEPALDRILRISKDAETKARAAALRGRIRREAAQIPSRSRE